MKSTNALSELTSHRRLSPAGLENLQESDFNTLRDPRIASTTDLSGTPDSSHHPDLSSEVATLSAKLVQAINIQTSLDDSLSATRQELESAQERLSALESENARYRADISSGIMVKHADVQSEILSMKTSLEEEQAKRAVAEKDKKEMEQELETLTAALFEEANKMVAAAKQEREAVEKKNEQLRAQIKDTEALVASQKEQLAELKTVMQEMNSQRDDTDTTPNQSTAPSSPAVAMQANLGRLLDSSNMSSGAVALAEISPAPSTSFPHLIKPVYRVDMVAYEDFRELLNFAKASKPTSRVASGSYGGLNVMGLASLASTGIGSNSGSPATSPNSQTPNSSPQQNVVHTPLKDTRFYKRILVEDFEPTLRLDAAPSISWLTRRSVFSSLCDGTLIVEPMPASHRKYKFPCGVCGERRTSNENERTHRFRTSESETAQRHSLCILCLEKIRACCDFAGYLRMILDGHVHVGDVEEEKEAWEETIRLRERIFWSRFGGGVVPSFISTDEPEKAVPVAGSAETKSEVTTAALSGADKGIDADGKVKADSIMSDVKTVPAPKVDVEVDNKEEDGADAEKQLQTDLETALPDASHSNAAADLPATPITKTSTQEFNDHDNSDGNDSEVVKAVPGAFD